MRGVAAERKGRKWKCKILKKGKQPPRLSMFEVSEIAVSKGIKTYLELLALAERQKAERKTDLAQFIVN